MSTTTVTAASTANVSQELRMDRLIEFLLKHPEGVTIGQIAKDQKVGEMQCRYVVQALRDLLGDIDSINLPCDPNPKDPKGQWLYRLVGNMADMDKWSKNRLRDTERRIKTQHKVICSVVTANKGLNTKEARKARLMKKTLGRLLEDLIDLEENVF